eukprot:526271_1
MIMTAQSVVDYVRNLPKYIKEVQEPKWRAKWEEEKRKIFDQFGEDGLKRGAGMAAGGGVPGGAHFQSYNFENSDMFKNMFSGGGHPKGFDMFSQFFGGDDAFGMFSNIGGGGGGFAQQGKRKMDPVNVDLFCSLEELFSGCTKKRKITRKRLNPDNRTCRSDQKILSIAVRPGWKAGTKVTFDREGDEHPQLEASDIIFIVKETPHPSFKRKGNDLIKPIAVSLKKALTGFTFTVKTLEGRQLQVPVPPIREYSPTGLYHTVPGEGMPISKSGGRQRGNLLLEMTVRVPDLSSSQKQKISAILG